MAENHNSPVLALVGSETLLGRELRELLNETKIPARLQLVGGVSDTGVLTEDEGEAAVGRHGREELFQCPLTAGGGADADDQGHGGAFTGFPGGQ